MPTAPPMHLGGQFPNFQCEACVDGKVVKDFDLYKYFDEGAASDNNWMVIFSHPNDFTPVCTTELGKAVKMFDDFKRRRCKMIAISCNGAESHVGWSKDIIRYCENKCSTTNTYIPFPIVADESRELATSLGIMDPDEKDDKTKMPFTCRAVFFLGPEKTLKAKILYPATTGRDFNEILRVLDSLQLTAKHPVATPESWTVGKECMVVPTLSVEDAKAKLPKGFELMEMPSNKTYMRFTADPTVK